MTPVRVAELLAFVALAAALLVATQALGVTG